MTATSAAPAKAPWLLLAVALPALAAACGDRPEGESQAADTLGVDTVAADSPTEAAPDYVGYTVLRGGDTLGTERVLRSPGRLGVQLEIDTAGGGPTLLLEATTGSDGLVRSLTVEPRQPGTGSGAARRTAVHFEGRQVVREVARGDSVVVDTIDVPEGTLPYRVPSVALAEQILLRAAVLEGDTVQVPLLDLEGEGVVMEAVVRRDTPTSATIRVGEDTEIRLTLDPEGRVARLEDVGRGITITRIR